MPFQPRALGGRVSGELGDVQGRVEALEDTDKDLKDLGIEMGL